MDKKLISYHNNYIKFKLNILFNITLQAHMSEINIFKKTDVPYKIKNIILLNTFFYTIYYIFNLLIG
jgi:hypothetical protein